MLTHSNITIFGGMTMGEVAFIKDEAEFDSLLENEALLVVDCTAAWCGPCKRVTPLMDQLAAEYRDRTKVFKLDVDHNKPVFQRFKVRGIPAVLFFKGGELKDKVVGAKPYEAFSRALDELL